MITLRPADERGHADHGWLNSYHTFSFANYYDPKHMGFRSLRVLNDDRVAPGKGFGAHGHRDMEIISYVMEGSLAHKDSMGNGSTIRPGDVQRMSAGTGVRHSEKNSSPTEAVHLLQIWILPHTVGLDPSYEQKAFTEDDRRNNLRLIASSDGKEGSVVIHQDASLYASIIEQGANVTHLMPETRYGWLQVARGAVDVNGEPADQGDGAVIVGESKIEIAAREPAEILLFDLP